MGIKKVKGKWFVIHHRTPGKIGKPIPSNPKGGHKTYKKALQQHKAIFARRGAK